MGKFETLESKGSNTNSIEQTQTNSHAEAAVLLKNPKFQFRESNKKLHRTKMSFPEKFQKRCEM